MWAYIHLLEGACVAGRFLGLDAGRMTNAIGVAFTQPVYPLMPGFMGPDSKLLIGSSTTVEGARAAELAARGWTGAQNILEDHQGFWRKYNEQNMSWMMSGLGSAWVSDSLTYKIVPGCAYIDTAIDAMREILAQFESKHGRRATPDDVADVHVRCGMFTFGMESFSAMYRSAQRLAPISINFSVALSFGLIFTSGALAPEFLSHKYLDANRESIESVAAKVRIEQDVEMDRLAAKRAESGGFSLRGLLSGAAASKEFGAIAKQVRKAMGDRPATQAKPEPGEQTLEGVSFEGYKMAFPAEVTLKTTSGEEYQALQDIPLGGSGRPWAQTELLARQKFLDNYSGDRAKAERAIAAIDRLEDVEDVREIVSLLAP
jgi:2-methylcitrate dehydratase PrpD